MPSKLKVGGVITALVTPFTADEKVDEEALRECVRFQLNAGVHGMFTLGTTGLGPVMSPDQRELVGQVVVNEVRGRVPVIIQVGGIEVSVSLKLAARAEKVGADAVASLPPFYYQPGSPAIIDYYRQLSRATSLPIFIYNIPRSTGVNIDAKLASEISKVHGIRGIKDSSRDFTQLLDFLEHAGQGFDVINGTDSYMFSAFCAGASACVSATANPFPELCCQLYNAYREHDMERGRLLQLKIHRLRSALGNPPISPLLEVLKMRGLRSGQVIPPLRSMTSSELLELRTQLARLVPEIKLVS